MTHTTNTPKSPPLEVGDLVDIFSVYGSRVSSAQTVLVIARTAPEIYKVYDLQYNRIYSVYTGAAKYIFVLRSKTT